MVPSKSKATMGVSAPNPAPGDPFWVCDPLSCAIPTHFPFAKARRLGLKRHAALCRAAAPRLVIPTRIGECQDLDNPRRVFCIVQAEAPRDATRQTTGRLRRKSEMKP